MKYAGFWRRNIAIGIDTTILTVVICLLAFVLNIDTTGFNLVYQAMGVAYFVFMTASKYQGTLGQKLLSIQIGDLSGNRVSVLSSIKRYFFYVLPSLPVAAITFLPQYSEINNEIMNSINSEQDLLNYVQQPEVMKFFQIQGILGMMSFIGILVWTFTLVFHKEKAGIHDLICKQRAFIVKEK